MREQQGDPQRGAGVSHQRRRRLHQRAEPDPRHRDAHRPCRGRERERRDREPGARDGRPAHLRRPLAPRDREHDVQRTHHSVAGPHGQHRAEREQVPAGVLARADGLAGSTRRHAAEAVLLRRAVEPTGVPRGEDARRRRDQQPERDEPEEQAIRHTARQQDAARGTLAIGGRQQRADDREALDRTLQLRGCALPCPVRTRRGDARLVWVVDHDDQVRRETYKPATLREGEPWARNSCVGNDIDVPTSTLEVPIARPRNAKGPQSGPSSRSGRQDLNLRPPGPQPGKAVSLRRIPIIYRGFVVCELL